VLVGNVVTFTASLAGATSEASEPIGNCLGAFGWRSVWYEWRTQERIPVLIQLVRGGTNVVSEAPTLRVFASTNLVSPPTSYTGGWPAVGCMPLVPIVDRPFIGFESKPGSAYYIEVRGQRDAVVELQLSVTPHPIIVEHPRGVTVSPGATALFKTTASSITFSRYQWLRDGISMPGETSPMLTITNVAQGDGGGYSVVVSNDTGWATSDIANLLVSPAVARPALQIVTGLAGIELNLAGEIGRSHRIEFTTNLLSWAPELILGVAPPTSVVIQTNSHISIGLTPALKSRFFRTSTYIPANDVCDATLKRIRHAKELWTRDTHRYRTSDTPTVSDLRPYYKDGVDPGRCPDDGFYAINPLDTRPTCSRVGHLLEEPR
jgi:hypothetical protein